MALTNAERQKLWRDKRNALARQAETMAKTFEKRTRRNGKARKPRPGVNPEVHAVLCELGDFLPDFMFRLDRWINTNPDFDDEACSALVQNLSTYSMSLQMLAQKVDERWHETHSETRQ